LRMTDDELRAMAMKVVAMTDAEEARGCNLFLEEKAANALGRAWLAEHPADDGEAVDAGWVEAVGFLNEDADEPTYWVALYPDLNPAFTVDVQADSDRHAGYIGEAEDYNPWPWDICTRGQVRDICRALGVELKGAGS
jgi:hypothetical protein